MHLAAAPGPAETDQIGWLLYFPALIPLARPPLPRNVGSTTPCTHVVVHPGSVRHALAPPVVGHPAHETLCTHPVQVIYHPGSVRHALAPPVGHPMKPCALTPCRWSSTLVVRAMRQDWSWSRSAQDYLRLYREVVGLQEGAVRQI